MSLHGHVLAEVRELDLDQLLGVEGAVPVAARAHRLRQHHASCENRLKESLAVDPPRDLPDEDGGEALRPQPLVHAQKVDLHHLHGLVVHPDGGWDGADEPEEFVVLRYSDSDVPVPE